MRLRVATDLDTWLARPHEHGYDVSMAAPRTHAVDDVSVEVFLRSRGCRPCMHARGCEPTGQMIGRKIYATIMQFHPCTAAPTWKGACCLVTFHRWWLK
jgi:hypothetical protein